MSGLVLTAQPRPGVLQLTLNRPEQRNALSAALLIELASILDAARDDDAVRCVVLTGDERAFSAGADIKEMVALGFDAINNDERQRAWDAIASFTKPLVAAVVGFAFGGGHELAMCADIIVASERARFGQPEVNIGVLPGDGATQRIPRAVGKSMAMQLILSGEPIDAETALAAGLVAEVHPVERTLERALDLAETIARKAPVAVRLAKQCVLAAYEMPLSAGLRHERQAIGLAFTTHDQREGMQAFVEKRPPKFENR